jgi:enoyl-CoA hydratase/carnithine racemase
VTSVDLELRDGAAVLTLNRPDAQNTIDLELSKDLDEKTKEIADVGRASGTDMLADGNNAKGGE